MRVILIGNAGDRDRLRWRLRQSGVAVAGEFASLASARASGARADGYLLAADADFESGVGGDAEMTPYRGRALPSADRRDADRAPRDIEALTTREREVLERLADGLPNKAIADALGISDQTVKFHVAQIMGKLGAANRTEAVRLAIRSGLIAV